MISQGIWRTRLMIFLERKRPQMSFLDLIRRVLCVIVEQIEEGGREGKKAEKVLLT
jgi:hypothetical protein